MTTTIDDELQPEYDFSKLRVRRMGKERQAFDQTLVRLAPDVATFFPDAESVNSALRFLIRVTQDGQVASLNAGDCRR